MTQASAHFDEEQGALIASGVWHAEAAAALPNLAGKTVRILDGAEKARPARLLLSDCLRVVLADGLRLLGLQAPERM